ncbi:MAG TPA: glycosyltransferase family A protein [Tepidisphaeraceae bacterium]|nr:glycosyltransferase family A protein [Tepidisphaeraceae bacterium]
MAENPLVSVVICTYNAGDCLRPAIQSILEQTYSRLEVLVVDDGSDDGSVTSARQAFADPRVRWFRQENAGKPVALNWAIRELRGEFYAIQDADDLSYPNRIERLVLAMQRQPEVAAVFSGHDLIIDGRHLAPRFRVKNAAACCRDVDRYAMPAHDPTAMYRMAMVRDIQYDTDLRVGQGYDYMLRVGEQWPMIVLGECLYSYRVSSSSVTRSDPQRRQKLVLEVIRRACQRRGIPFEQRPVSSRRLRGGASFRDNNIAAQFIDSVLDQRRAGQWFSAIRTGLQCINLHPLDMHYHKAFVYALSPWWLIRRLRRTGSEE